MKSGSKFSLFVVLAYLCIKHKDKVGMGMAEDEEMDGIEFVDIAGGYDPRQGQGRVLHMLCLGGGMSFSFGGVAYNVGAGDYVIMPDTSFASPISASADCNCMAMSLSEAFVASMALRSNYGVVGHLQSYFPGCAIEEHRELPVSCRLAAVTHRNYQGLKTHAAKLLSYLMAQDGGSALTPEEIRSATGLSQAQFKEAKKNREVIRYFNEHIQTYGSGINTVYYRKSNSICISPFQTVETTQKGGMSIAHGNPGRPEAGDHLADQSGSAEPGNTGDSGAHLRQGGLVL